MWKWDDYFLSAAWALALVRTILTCTSTRYGAGKPDFALSAAEKVMNLRFDWINRVLFIPILGLAKMSICALYLRVFSATKWGRYSMIACFTFIVLYTIPIEISAIVICKPVQKYWYRNIPGTCSTSKLSFWIIGVCTLVSDLWILAVVTPRIIKLNLRLQQKVALLLIVSMGWIAFVSGIMRIVRVNMVLSRILNNVDISATMLEIGLWTSLEADISVVCAAAPGVRPLFRKILPSCFSSAERSCDRVNLNEDAAPLSIFGAIPSSKAYSLPHQPQRAMLPSDHTTTVDSTDGTRDDCIEADGKYRDLECSSHDVEAKGQI